MVHWILAQIQASFYIISRSDIQKPQYQPSAVCKCNVLFYPQQILDFMNENTEVFLFKG